MKKLIVITPLLFLLSGCGAQWFPDDSGFTNNSTATLPTVPSSLTDSTGAVIASNLLAKNVGSTQNTVTIRSTMTVQDNGYPGNVTVILVAIDKTTGAELASTQTNATGSFLVGNGEAQTLTALDVTMSNATLSQFYKWKFKQVTFVPY